MTADENGIVAVRHLGDRAFLVIDRWWLPIDKIKEINTDADKTHNVEIIADGETYKWTGIEADEVREALSQSEWRQ